MFKAWEKKAADHALIIHTGYNVEGMQWNKFVEVVCWD